MLLKHRTKSYELIVLEILNGRMGLSSSDQKRIEYLEKGYQGELMFDQLTAKLRNDLYIINDLRLESKDSELQIDTFIISKNTIFPFEVKNYEGDYRYDSESDNFYPKNSKDEINNPLSQLKRSNSLLRPILKSLGNYSPIEGYVTFVNPEFTLYQAPLNAPIIYPTQLNSLMKKLNAIPSTLTDRHRILAEQLISLHQPKSRYSRYPDYRYEQLRKGILCALCHFFATKVGEKKITCDKCGHEETVESAVLRCVAEIKLLFPEMKITTNLVHEWCGVIGSKKQIRRILLNNFTSIDTRQHRYFV